MPKIPLLTHEEANEEQRRIAKPIYEARGGLTGVYGNPYGVLLHFPELAERASNLGSFLRDAGGGTLPKRISELVIALTARHWTCQYEWSAHHHQALNTGLPQEALEAIRVGATPQFDSDEDSIAFEYVRDLYKNRGISESLHRRAVDAFGEKGVISIVAIAGYYSFLALVCNAFDLEVTRKDPPPRLTDTAALRT